MAQVVKDSHLYENPAGVLGESGTLDIMKVSSNCKSFHCKELSGTKKSWHAKCLLVSEIENI